MSRKFIGLNGVREDPALDADYSGADRFDPLRVGELGIYFRKGFKTNFISYEELEGLDIREQTLLNVPRCGRAIHCYFHLVFLASGAEHGDIISEDRKLLEKAAALIRSRTPHLA